MDSHWQSLSMGIDDCIYTLVTFYATLISLNLKT